MDALSGLVVRDSGTCDRKERNSNMTHEIDALEGEALAAAVATRVMGWNCPQDSRLWYDGLARVEIAVNCYRPDRDIAQAFEAVDRIAELHPEWYFCLDRCLDPLSGERIWRAVWLLPDGWTVYRGRCPDRCIAICRACLKAVGEA
jgi:hypothetical protein